MLEKSIDIFLGKWYCNIRNKETNHTNRKWRKQK
nr:MAG TPA: hypothetical protein [Caudoviricetes sp.]